MAPKACQPSAPCCQTTKPAAKVKPMTVANPMMPSWPRNLPAITCQRASGWLSSSSSVPPSASRVMALCEISSAIRGTRTIVRLARPTTTTSSAPVEVEPVGAEPSAAMAEASAAISRVVETTQRLRRPSASSRRAMVRTGEVGMARRVAAGMARVVVSVVMRPPGAGNARRCRQGWDLPA